jgi:hypothetical protein
VWLMQFGCEPAGTHLKAWQHLTCTAAPRRIEPTLRNAFVGRSPVRAGPLHARPPRHNHV